MAVRIQTFFSRNLLLLVLLLGLGLVALAQSRVLAPRAERPIKYLMPPKDLEHFTFGYREVVADSMWITVIQDLDVCEQTAAQITLVNGDPRAREIKNGQCHLGWVYHIIDTITELAPRFRIPYIAGGVMLSTIVNDREGASRIFQKGRERLSADWNLLYYAGYHELVEMNRPALAAEYLVEAGKHGAPEWVIALAGKLYSKAGQVELAKKVIKETLEAYPDNRWSKALQARLEELEKINVENKGDQSSAQAPLLPPSRPSGEASSEK